MKIAMFGGSFNPVHNGHVALAKAVHEQAGYDKVLFVPAYHSPFKDMPSGASDDDRLCMLRLALDGFDWACVEDCEFKRGGVSYTYDTVEFLVQKYTEAGELTGKLGLVIGADLVEGFHRWHRAEELAEKVDIILARRNLDVPTPDATSHLPFVHYELQNPYVDVSSSGIRTAVHAAAQSATDSQSGVSGSSQVSAQSAKNVLLALVPESVCDYILKRGLYD
ncbi:MAG: nicotinate (nicotinamide) nucleotide adenylyltransferase [Treponemataceae bacterium]|nr:nicotinate (nicotinamide) nucleotide adenylyltransferase [Treponemataceae bacterium]